MKKFNPFLIFFSDENIMQLSLDYLTFKKIIKKSYNKIYKFNSLCVRIESSLNKKEMFKLLSKKIGNRNFIIKGE